MNASDPWRVITTWGAEPSFNMGLDEALLEPGSAPTLRFYTWSPDTLSLGYFQRFDDVPSTDSAGAVVRRVTGGGAIHHQHELTFSLSAEQDHPIFQGPVAKSYERIHAALVGALSTLGLRAGMCRDQAVTSDRDDTGMCFHKSTPLDIIWDGAKGIGSAQRRTAGRVLHHGSIKLGTTPLEGEIATLSGSGVDLDTAQLAAVVREAFTRTLGLRLESGVPSEDEIARARELGARYLDPEFVRRR
ncbi:MAG: lipoate-protein ligase A [Planctomycetota bacterium]|jgi:lipoate-protein ligase A